MTGRLLRLAAIASLIVALDQWTKAWATRTLSGRPPVDILGELVRLTYTRNSGVAFGLGAGLPFPYYLFSIAAVLVILWLFARQKVTGGARQFALALILGGAIGNLIDRVLAGEVVDFIEIGWGRWHWPVFNVADSAVSIGVVLFALTWPRKHEPRAADPPTPLVAGPHQGSGDDPSARLGGPDPESGRAAGSLPRHGAD